MGRKTTLRRARKRSTRRAQSRRGTIALGNSLPKRATLSLPFVDTNVSTSVDGSVAPSADGIAYFFDRLEDVSFLDADLQRPRGYNEFFNASTGLFKRYKVTGVTVTVRILRNSENFKPIRYMIRPFGLDPIHNADNALIANTTSDGADWEEWKKVKGQQSGILAGNSGPSNQASYHKFFSMRQLLGRNANLIREAAPASTVQTTLDTHAWQIIEGQSPSKQILAINTFGYAGLQIWTQTIELGSGGDAGVFIRTKLVYHVTAYRDDEVDADTADVTAA